MTAASLGLTGGQGVASVQSTEGDQTVAATTDSDRLSIGSPESANIAIATVDNALRAVSRQRADLGAYQNRFETAAKGIAIAAENLQAAESRIRDTDMASEMVQYTKNQILTQSGTAMLAQANAQSQTVLALLR